MDSLISMFHLDTKLLLAQLINFTIVMLVLWFFAVKPLIKVMGERTAKIEKSLREAKEIEEKMAQTEAERQKVLDQTKKEALVLLEQSRK
jgi:F-type H+-transporting ATPase subunit b